MFTHSLMNIYMNEGRMVLHILELRLVNGRSISKKRYLDYRFKWHDEGDLYANNNLVLHF